MAHSAPHSLAPAAGFVSPALSQRAIVLIGIVAFHVVLVYLLATGLGSTVLNVVLPSLQGEIIPDPPQPVEQPVVPPPNIRQMPPLDVPPPVVSIVDPPPSDGGLLTMVSADPPPVAPVQPQPRVEPLQFVGRNVLPNTEDYYPPAARREGVEGATNVQVCVDERGKRQGEPTVTQSSGDPRLDRGAIGVARDGRYARARRGDAFVPNCYGFRVIFTMKP